MAGVEAGLWIPVFALVLGSAIGVFYYLRVVVALFSRTAAEEALAHGAHGDAHAAPAHATVSEPAVPPTPVPLGAGLVLLVLAVLVIWLGTWPAPVLRLIESSVSAGM